MKQFLTISLFFYTLSSSIAQFTYTGGPEGYNITHMAAQGDSLLAVTGNQVYLNSTRGSKQWLPFSQGLYSKDSLVRAFQAHQGRYFLAQAGKVFSLAAGSSTWQDRSKGIKGGHLVNQLLSLDNWELLARAYDGVQLQYFWYHYESAKQEWQPIDPLALVGLSPAIALLPNGNILAYSNPVSTTPQYRARFDASTRKWQRVDTLNLALFGSVVALSNTELLAGATSFGALYRSTDGGKVWSALSSPVTTGSVRLYKTNKAIYAVATEYIGQSTDGGKTWKEVNDFAFIAASSPFVGNDSSSYVIARGIPFFHVNTLELDGAFSIELDAPFYCNNLLFARDNLFLYGLGGIFAFDDTAEEPAISNYNGNLPSTPMINTQLAKAGADLVGLTSTFGFYRHTPATGWQLSMTGMDLFIPYLNNSRSMATRQDTVIVFDGYFSSFYSTNRGQSWKEVDYTPYLFTFQGFANGRKHLYAGYDRELYRWVGKKLEWEELKRPGNNLPISNLLTKGDTLMVNTSSGWFYTVDDGQQWRNMVTPTTNASFYISSNGKAFVAELPSSLRGAQLFEIKAQGTKQNSLLSTATNVGFTNVAIQDSFILAMPTPNQGFIYFSSNGGRTWRNLDTRSLGFVNNALFDGDKVYLGTTTGVWTMPLSRLTTGLFDPRPLVQSLEVWPNPGTDRLQIKVPGELLEGSVQLKLYNILGQLVHSQKVSIWNSGVELDMSQQAPGQYLILLSTPEKVWSAKWIKH